MKLQRDENLEIQIEEVQDIISHVPSGLIRWGISVIFLFFIGLLLTSWFVKYPDVMKAKVLVTTDPAPINLVSRTSGRIILLKKVNERVKKNDLIAYLQSNASISDITYLEKSISDYKIDPNAKKLFVDLNKNINTGDLQSFVNATIESLQDLISFSENNLQEKQIAILNKQVLSYKNLNKNLQKQLDLMKQECFIGYQQFKADSLLFSQRVIAPLEFNKSHSAYLLQQRSLRSMEASLINNQLQADALEKQVTELQTSNAKESIQLYIFSNNALNELSARLRAWKEDFLFYAPIDGTIAYLGFIERDQFIESGTSLFALLPSSNRHVAKAELPLHGAAKVKIGQQVNIRLSNYPFEQFGMLSGTVKSISLVPDKENYSLEISLTHGMISTYNKELTFSPQLQGEMDIITEDLRLLERVFFQLRKLVSTHQP